MYNDNDLQEAAEDGLFSPEAVSAFRDRSAARRHFPRIDEEHYRIFDGSNDAFTTVGCLLAIAGLANLGYLISPVFAGIAAVLGAWGLAEYFVRIRRLTLTGIVLSLVFVIGIVAAFVLAIVAAHPDWGPKGYAGAAAFVALVTAAGAWAFWDRFRVPYMLSFVPFFASVFVLAVTVMFMNVGLMFNPANVLAPVALLCGLGMFAYAMKWDLSDPYRVTQRHEVAVWLHGAAAGMIVQPLFYLLGVSSFGYSFMFITFGQILTIVALYALFVVIGLAIDRRALPFAGLAGLLYALAGMFLQLGAYSTALGLAGIIGGAGLLLLSVFWHRARAAIVPMLGSLGDRLPPLTVAPRADEGVI